MFATLNISECETSQHVGFRCGCHLQGPCFRGGPVEWELCKRHQRQWRATHAAFVEQYGACSSPC